MALEVKKKYPVPRVMRAPAEKLPQRTLRREKRQRTARRITTSALVMVFIAMVGGIVYTWYTGQQKPRKPSSGVAIGVPRAVFKPPKIASNSKIGIAVQTVTSPIKAGENTAITVRTNPEASCKIKVEYNKVPAVDSGLVEPKLADEFGIASWSWTVPVSAPPGNWPIEITCHNKANSSMVRSDLEVLK